MPTLSHNPHTHFQPTEFSSVVIVLSPFRDNHAIRISLCSANANNSTHVHTHIPLQYSLKNVPCEFYASILFFSLSPLSLPLPLPSPSLLLLFCMRFDCVLSLNVFLSLLFLIMIYVFIKLR